MADWERIFSDSADKQPPATDEDIAFLNCDVLSPLTETERITLDDDWDFTAPEDAIPSRPFPDSYVQFLRWSNGGAFQNGQRPFSHMFSIAEIRENLLGYGIPAFMPQAVPFAFDGGGSFYLFDMREPSFSGEYPIVFNHCSALGWAETVVVASSFVDACTGTVHPWDL